MGIAVVEFSSPPFTTCILDDVSWPIYFQREAKRLSRTDAATVSFFEYDRKQNPILRSAIRVVPSAI